MFKEPPLNIPTMSVIRFVTLPIFLQMHIPNTLSAWCTPDQLAGASPRQQMECMQQDEAKLGFAHRLKVICACCTTNRVPRSAGMQSQPQQSTILTLAAAALLWRLRMTCFIQTSSAAHKPPCHFSLQEFVC